MGRILRLAGAALLVLAALGAGRAGPLDPPSRQDAPASAARVVYLVRHAEPGPGDDPSLSAAGRQRAQELGRALRDAGIGAILTSEFRRTRETAQPLAAALGLTPRAIEARDMDAHIAALAAAVRGNNRGATLVVGHGETVPSLIAALGGPRLADLCEDAFDRLFVLVLDGGSARLARARYGEASPPPGPDCS